MSLSEAEIVAAKQSVPETSISSFEPGAQIGDQYKEFRPLYKQFNVPEESGKMDETFKKVWDWAKSSAIGKDKDSILFEVIRLKNRLGSPSPGETPWSKVSNYINVWNQARIVESRLSELENG